MYFCFLLKNIVFFCFQADPKKQKGVKMQGFLNKKKDQKEKWKSQYFVLKQEGADCHMYIYEHPKRTKPKGMVFYNQISFNSEAFFRLVSVRKSAAYLILEC